MNFTHVKWKKFLAILLMVVTLIAVSWEIMIPTGIEYYLTRQLSAISDKKLVISNLHRENERWVFDGPYVHGGKGLQLNTLKSALNYKVDLWNGVVDLVVVLEQPTLSLNQTDWSFTDKIKKSKTSSNLIKLNGTLIIQKGEIVLGDRTCHVDGEVKFGSSTEGHLSFDFQEGLSENEKLHLSFSNLTDLSKIHVQCVNVECQTFHHTLGFIHPYFRDFVVHDGILHGSAGVHIAKDKHPIIYAEGSLSAFSFSHQKSDLKGTLKEIRFNLNSDLDRYTHSGNVILSGEGRIYSKSALWDISHLIGGVHFDEQNRAKIALHGLYDNAGNTSQLTLEGHAQLPVEQLAEMNLFWKLSGDKADSEGSLQYISDNTKERTLNFRCRNGRSQELVVLQQFLKENFPVLQQVQLNEGLFNFDSTLSLVNGQPKKLDLKNILVSNLDVHYLPYTKNFFMAEATGHCQLKLSGKDILNTLTAQIDLHDGKITPKEELEALFGLNQVNAHISVQDGVYQNAFIEGNLDGMQARAALDPSDPEVVKFTLKGPIEHIAKVIKEEHFKNELLPILKGSELQIAADLTKLDQGCYVEGQAKILRAFDTQKFEFGFDLTKAGFNRGEEDLFISTLLEMPKNYAEALIEQRESRLKEHLASKKYRVENGWFHAADLPLEVYLQPLVFRQGGIDLKGTGAFTGAFDQESLLISYEMQKVQVQNTHLGIEADEIKHNPANPVSQSAPVHYVDLHTGDYLGVLPLFNASYFEKNSGLLFTDVNAQVIFEGYDIHLPAVETFSNGIYMNGSIDLVFNDLMNGVFDLDIITDTLHGNLSQLQGLLSHFQKTEPFARIPIEGNVLLSKAANMHFAFNPDRTDFTANFKGSLADGQILSTNSDISLQEIGLNFDYDHEANRLKFSDIQGTVLVGDPQRVEEYTLVGEKIDFVDLANSHAVFDVWVGDKKRDIIRLSGETLALADSEGVQFKLDKHLSHFGDVHPSTFDLVLKDGSEVTEFRLVADFKLNTLFKDLQRFSRTGFFFLSRNMLKQLNQVKKAEGLFKLNVDYDRQNSQLTYNLEGDRVAVDDYAFNRVSLEGKKSGNTWMIDQFKLDEVSFAADILRKEKSWLINFLGVKAGQSLQLGLQGEYFDENQIAQGKIHLLEVDIAHLGEFPKIQERLNAKEMTGRIKANGDFQYATSEQEPAKFETKLNASIKDCGVKNAQFEDMHAVICRYESGRGFTIDKIGTRLKSADGQHVADLTMGRLNYDSRREEVALENLDFSIPSPSVAWALDLLTTHFAVPVSQDVKNIIVKLKDQGNLEGTLHVDYAAPHVAVNMTLKDGMYDFLNRKHRISNFVFDYDPFEVRIVLKDHIHKPYWITYRASSSLDSRGDIVITNEPPATMPENPLVIKWQNHPDAGFTVDEAVGSFRGANFALYRSQAKEASANAQFLVGEVVLNAQEAAHLISKDLADKLANWQIGAGYYLKGNWDIYQADNVEDGIRTFFDGKLEGNNFEFKGYRFAHMTSDMTSNPETIHITNMAVSDEAGRVYIDEIKFNESVDGLWTLHFPCIKVQEFRPSILNKIGEEPSLVKPLVFRDIELRDLYGNVGYTESFTGNGTFMFVNALKRNSPHLLVAIPAEILTRIGLDLAVLNPVIGTVNYEVRDGRIYLTRLKDVYSQGKMSKFYLPSRGDPSYIDFDGNLQIQIKMKQYNLIFKLAELFTVTVQGTVNNPTYSLQKQK